MKRALVISSQVAASSVGANNTAFCLRRLGVETIVLPTTLMGRHPGWGDPGGRVTTAEILADMWQGIAAQNLQFDAIVTGFMGSVENTALAASIIHQLKSKNPDISVIVDPVMGDNGKLYVPVDVAEAITTQLIPKADIVTPNVWEFSHIVQSSFKNRDDVKTALLDYSGCALVTSVEHQSLIGALSYHPNGLTYIGHQAFGKIPNGGGDTVTGILAAHVLNGKTEEDAALRAISSVFSIMKTAVETNASEFPLTLCQNALTDAPLLGIDRLL